MAFLIAKNGPNAGHKCDLKGPHCVMGRNPDCEIVVDVVRGAFHYLGLCDTFGPAALPARTHSSTSSLRNFHRLPTL